MLSNENESETVNIFSMEILTQPNYQAKHESEFFFDSYSRNSYFAKLEEALTNLSLVDNKRRRLKTLAKK